MNHPLWTMGNVFAINSADLARGITFKITPSKAFKRASPNFQPVDVWRAILTSEAACRCGVFGTISRPCNGFYVCMNYNHMPVMPNKDSLTKTGFMLFQENNLVTYRGTTCVMISWAVTPHGVLNTRAKNCHIHHTPRSRGIGVPKYSHSDSSICPNAESREPNASGGPLPGKYPGHGCHVCHGVAGQDKTRNSLQL